MKKQKLSLLTISIILMIIIAGILVFIAISIGEKYPNYQDERTNRPIQIIGNYKIDNGPWLKLTEDTHFNTTSYRIVTIKGHFSREIPASQDLLFYMPCLSVSLKIDGKEAYAFRTDEDYPQIVKSPGYVWANYSSPGISPNAEVEFVMRNAYLQYTDIFRVLLDSMQTGSRSGLYKEMFTNNKYVLFFSIFFIFVSVMTLLLALIAYFWRVLHASKAAASAFFAVTMALTGFFDLNFFYIPLLIPNPTVASICDILIMYMMFPAATLCILAYGGERTRTVVKFLGTPQCMLMTAMCLMQIFGISQLYEMQPFFLLTNYLIFIMSFVLSLYDAFKYDNTETKLMLATIFPAVAAGTLDIWNSFFPFMPTRVLFSTGASITLLLQIFQIIYMIKRSNDAIIQKQHLENELTKSRISIMLSQIQPHFLYNSLTAIAQLCEENPAEAKKMTIDFAIYLRGNMSSLNNNDLIPFAEELAHTERYLNLEKAIYEDDLNIVYNIETTDFMLPPLTLQPIVENAVKHGIGQREGGGTITISVKKSDKEYILIVSDDGMGYAINEMRPDKYFHIGIDNVKQRLAEQCGGILEIASVKETGTSVSMKIPQEISKGKY